MLDGLSREIEVAIGEVRYTTDMIGAVNMYAHLCYTISNLEKCSSGPANLGHSKVPIIFNAFLQVYQRDLQNIVSSCIDKSRKPRTGTDQSCTSGGFG